MKHICPDRMKGKRVIVAGGGSGIGRASAVRLASEGAEVFIADLREKLADQTARAIVEAGGRANWTRCDIGSEQDVETMTCSAVEAMGGLDVLVVSAGLYTRGSTHELTLHDWEMVLRVNLTGYFLCLRSAIPHMLRAGGGSIVTVGSVSAVVVGAGSSAVSYKASKAGVLQLTRSVAIEYAAERIRANCVCPGGVETNFGPHSLELAPLTTSGITREYPQSPIRAPLGRKADADEVAAVIAFLASDESSYVTGSAVMVDGGYTAI